MTRFRRKIRLPIDLEYFMSFTNGIEAGLATTAAIIAGLITGTDDRAIVVNSALIAIVVQAFNSAAIRISSERTVDEIENSPDQKSYFKPIIDAIAQFTSHVTASLIILMPSVFVISLDKALVLTVIFTLFLLFILGIVKGIVIHKYQLRNAIEALTLGALVISVGILAGSLLNA